MNIKLAFHYISYLQYPLMLIALYFAIKPHFNDMDIDGIIKEFNNVLIFMGLGISFSTLQDTTKTQNKLSRKIWEHPVKGKVLIGMMFLITLFLMIRGLTGYFSSVNSNLKELSIGIIILAIGLLGMLKSAIEMFENHRKDKK
ncbi:hypothetical protein [Spongiimicrobium salis]|uniref:hypothetical protein n=1 Tax=Spongiimicrobium salis TaxID=1667022 RepID=UPI00374D3682